MGQYTGSVLINLLPTIGPTTLSGMSLRPRKAKDNAETSVTGGMSLPLVYLCHANALLRR